MIIHLFNSSIVSGPEALALPALVQIKKDLEVWFLLETRIDLDPLKNPVIYAENLGLKVRTIAVDSRCDIKAICELSEFLLDSRAQLIHAHDVKATIYLIAAHWYLKNVAFYKKKLFYKQNTPKLVSTHHGIQARMGLKLRFYERLYCVLSALFLDRLYTVCNSDAVRLLNTWWVPNKKITPHLNGVTRKCLSAADRSNLRTKYLPEWSFQRNCEFPYSGIYIGIIGRLSIEKNHRRLISVFEKLHQLWTLQDIEQPRSLSLLIFGSGPLENALKSQVQKLGMQNQIHFMGYHANMSEKMGALDMVWSLSYGEGLPINLIEAGWAATSVLTNRIDGNIDLISDSHLGLLVDDNDNEAEVAKKLLLFLLSQESIDRMGHSFQKHVQKHFSENRWLTELKNNYKDLGVGV